METLKDRLSKIKNVIVKDEFLENKGLGNEVGYYVFDYNESEELTVRAYLDKLEKSNVLEASDFELVVYDLYDLMIDYIVSEGLLEMCYEMETEHGIQYLISNVVELLNMNSNVDYFNKYIEAHTPKKAVVFVTGVGKIFPFVRSHEILNKLHQLFDRVPVALFYPGTYDGLELRLFSEFKDDNYYRAFPLV